MADNNTFAVLAVSDATGSLAYQLSMDSCLQFDKIKYKIYRKAKVKSEKRICELVAEAKEKNAVIVFTMASQDFRRLMLSEAKKEGVVAMDVMGPLLDMFSHYFHQLPSNEPGLQYQVTQDYYKRTESIDFAVRHDDGLHVEGFKDADVVLLGLSRCSKTPLSIYLAYQGFRCANLTLVKGVPLPEAIKNIDPKNIVGLLASPERIVSFRSSRLKSLGRPDSEQYAQLEHIQEELIHAQKIYSDLGIRTVDLTGRAIEEVAGEVIQLLGL